MLYKRGEGWPSDAYTTKGFAMRKVNFRVSAAVAICLLVAPVAAGQHKSSESRRDPTQQIETLQRQVVEALLKGDSSFFEKYFADQATIIHGSGARTTKEQEINNLKSGTLKYESYNVRDQQVHVYGSTAIVNALVFTTGTMQQKRFDGDYRASWVWVDVNGTWKLVLRQITRVSPNQ